jgi:hypothetical protein
MERQQAVASLQWSRGMLELKKQVFGDLGYSADMKLTASELEVFRRLINDHWLTVIDAAHPELTKHAQADGIDNYHQISDRMDHNKLWSKRNRVLPQSSVDQIKSLPFITQLKKEFGEFSISDIYDTQQHHGKEEIYWRLVRPNKPSDIGSLHRDCWFHDSFNNGYGMFLEGTITIKVWIPIFCEPGKSGLALVAGSHLREWNYHLEMTNGVAKPILDEDLSTIDAKLIPTEPGNMLIFNENVLHGGVVNRGEKTRVSAEITMVMSRSDE